MNPLTRILLVEDDPADARLALEALAAVKLDSQTLQVPDGIQALDYLLSRGRYQNRPPGHPAAILLDVKIPGIDGLSLLERIRADELLRLIPVVMLTASRQESDVRRAYELGANGYLVKHIDFSICSSHLRAFGQFFANSNEPPPGSLPAPRMVFAAK
jgi:CheY-like chemotaxis protein